MASPIVTAAITEGLAELTEVTSLPETPYGLGCDLWCESDLDPLMTEITDSALVLAQHCLRRITTPTGSLPDDDEWGIDVTAYCNRPTERRELDALEGEIQAELSDDDRIDELGVAVTASDDYTTLTIELRIVPLDPETNDFSLTLSVSDVGAIIEEMRG